MGRRPGEDHRAGNHAEARRDQAGGDRLSSGPRYGRGRHVGPFRSKLERPQRLRRRGRRAQTRRCWARWSWWPRWRGSQQLRILHLAAERWRRQVHREASGGNIPGSWGETGRDEQTGDHQGYGVCEEVTNGLVPNEPAVAEKIERPTSP